MANDLINAIASILALFASYLAQQRVDRVARLEEQIEALSQQIEVLTEALEKAHRREKKKRKPIQEAE